MKKLFYPILLIILSGNFNFCFGQKWLENLPTNKSKSEITFYDYQNAFDQYQKSLNAENGYYRDENGEKVRVSGFKQFKRWEYYMQGIIDPSTGAFPSENPFEIYAEYQRNQSNSRSTTSADWKSLGPNNSEGGYAGIGRLNCISFHPTDTNTYWVGAASGGLWVTNDDGASWTCLTDKTGVLAVSDIVIPSDYETSQTIYIATGDKDAWDNRSIGVLKSTNRGESWNTTGLTFSIASPKMVNRLLIDPNNNEIIIAATTDGVFKTFNGGVTWNQQITNLDFIDMEFKPNDFNTLYGAVKYDGKIYTSTNGGMTWTIAYSNSNINRIELAVSENQNGWVYGVASDENDDALYGILKSTNSGVSFQRIYSSKNLLGRTSNGSDNVGQGSYDLSIAVSKSDANTIIVGGINTWRSINGGTSWQLVNHWVGDGAQEVHADKHQLKYRFNGDLFECNDGGLYISKNNGTTWTDKSNGLVISQIYKLGNSQIFSNEVITGLQDNGTKLQMDSDWVDVFSGDGMNCIIDPSNNNIQYACSQRGEIGKTLNHWKDIEYIKPPNSGEGAWVTPYVLDPNDPATIYAGYRYLYKSIDRGGTWTRPNPNSFWSLLIHHIAIAPSNSNTLYLAGYDRIWKTIDGGQNVFNIANNLPLSSGNITSVSVKNDDENTVWVTLGGYTNPGVFQSTNGGQTWVKISNGLPILPAYTLVQNKLLTNEDHLYVGTELGVYFKKGGENWIPFNQGLPNVKIGELEIYYDGNPDLSTLRAATYGRGLWESNLIPQIPIEMEYQNATTVHTNLSKVNPSNKNVEILRIQIDTKGSINPIKLKSINFNTHGTSDINDIESIKMYYSKSKMLFDTLQIVSSISNVINDTIRFNLDQELNNGKNYFWLAYDIKNTAHLGNILDAQLISFKLDTIEYILNQDPVGNRVIELNYCTAGSTLPTSYNYISNVTIGKINNNSLKGQNGYQNFRNISDSLSIGRTIDFKINLNQPFTKDQIRIWVDFNRNGIFEDSNELVYFSPGINTQSLIQGNFLIPSNAIPGSTTMRIRQHYTDFEPNFTSCGTSSWGEVEDYSVILYQQPIAGNASSNSPICVNDSLIIQLQNFFGNIKWQKSKNGLTDWQYCNEGLGYNSSHYKSLIDTSTFFRAEVVLETFSPVYSNIVEVIVNQNPEVYINSTNGLNFCSTETSNLYTESNYYSYTWNTGDTMPSIEVATNGSYFVNVVDNKGCSGISNTIQITVNQNPSVSLSIFGLPTFCFGDSLILATESIDYSFVWSTNNTSQSINVYDSGDYFVMVTDSNGCTAISDTITVLVHALPMPTVNASGATTFCSGNNVTLSSSITGVSYLWSNNETTQSISPTTTGNYSVALTDANGCTVTSTAVNITVNPLPLPIVNASGVTTFCSGNSVTLSSSITGVSYSWSNNATTQSISATTTGNYSVEVTDANGCTGTSTITNVTVNPLPTPILNTSGATTFCSGNSVTLSSSITGVSYLWSNNETTQSISATTTGNYSVEVTDANGCTGTSTITSVTVNPLPTPILNTNGATTFCLGNSVTLSSSITGVSYLWSNNETTQSIIVSTSENYTLMLTDSKGCTAISDTITVLVHTLPDATLLTDGNLSFCFGDSISISCTESSTYLWNSGETSKEIVVKNSGHYLVTVTDSFGCSAISDSIGVVVHNLPEITLTPGGVTTFCKGDSVTLFSSQAVSYLWSSGATTQNITVYNSGNYFINIIDSNNCQAESPPINVVVNELPVPIISSNEPTNFCQGDSITLMSSHAVSYLWNTLDTIRSIIVSKSGDYFVIVTDDNGCKGKSIPLTVVETDNPIANISLSRSPIMCLGDSIILSADNAESYLWSNGSTTQSVIINTEGQFSVTVINSMGCISVSPSITVVINPLPISAIEIIGETSFCQGESVNLKATFAISYAWSNNATTQNINVSTSGTYIVSTTDINGCSAASSPILVTVHSLPTPNISSNGETTFCLGGTVTLTSSSAASYLWLNGSTSQSIDVITTGDYLLTVTDVNGCTGVTSQNVLVNELPNVVIDFIGETSFCKGNQLVISANDAETYLWSTGEITKSVEITETGTYTVSIMDANGCVGVSTGINTIVFPLPSSAVTVIGELEFCRNDSLILTADPAKDYLWSTGDSSQTIIVKSSGEYRVTITDSNGCSAISSNHSVKVNDLPLTEIVANGPTNICFGETLILTSGEAVSYLWSNSDENQSIEVSTSGTYIVTITDENGCKGVSSPITITLLPLPSNSITLSGPPAFCEGDSITIKASSVDSYLWNTGETNQSLNTSTEGDYVVTVTDINGCTAVSTTISITVHALPVAQITPDGPTTFCQGKSVTLTADSTLNYKWNTDETSQSINVSSEGVYFVTVTNENGCSAISLPTAIIIFPLPVAMIVPDGPATFCKGGNVILTASEAQSYNWNSGQTSRSVDITSPGVYVVTVTDANGCSVVSSEILVIVNPLLTPEVIISTPAISVLSCQDVTFTPTPINGGISPTYQWFVNGNPVSSSPSFSTSTLINDDQVSCIMTSSATCKSTPTATSNTLIMSVSQLPQPTIIISEDTISSDNYKDAQYLYSWYFNGNEVSTSPYIICNQFGSGSYYLVINYNGCTDTSNTTDIICSVPTNDIDNSIYFMVYPNPTNNVINISGINLSSGEFRIEAYNVLGQKLEEKRILSSNDILDSYLDMSSYASGIYTIVVYGETYRQVFKVHKIE